MNAGMMQRLVKPPNALVNATYVCKSFDHARSSQMEEVNKGAQQWERLCSYS